MVLLVLILRTILIFSCICNKIRNEYSQTTLLHFHKAPRTQALSHCTVSGVFRLGTLALSQTAAAADDYQTIDGVGVTAQALKIDVSLQDTPQSVNIVTREHLDNTVATKIDDSLRYTPGFLEFVRPGL